MALKFGEGYVPIYLTGMGGFTSGLGRARAVFQQSLTGMEAVARRARIGLLLGAAIGAGIVKAAASFEQGMARVQALTSATGGEFDSLRTQALLLGRTTVYSARQASDAMGYFALAGFSTDKIMRAMPATLNLAAAGQMDVAQAADIAAKLMAGMGIEADNLDHAIDVMAKAFTTSNTDLVQLGTAFKYVGPVAKSAGVSLEEITATLMAVSNAGIQASTAGTTMRGVLARLGGQPTELKKVFADLGITIMTTGGKLRPLADLFDDLNRAMADMGEGERMGQMMKAFGVRAGVGFLELLSVGGDAIREMQASLEDAGGTAERIAKIQLNTLQGSWIMLKSAAEGLAIELGDQLIPHMRSFVDRLKEAAAYLAGLSDEEQRSIVTTAAMTMRLLALLTVMPMVAAAMGGLIAALLAFGGAPVGIFIALTAAVSALGLSFIEAAARGTEWTTMLEHYKDHLMGLDSELDRATTLTEKFTEAQKELAATMERIRKLEGRPEPPESEARRKEKEKPTQAALTEATRQREAVEKRLLAMAPGAMVSFGKKGPATEEQQRAWVEKQLAKAEAGELPMGWSFTRKAKVFDLAYELINLRTMEQIAIGRQELAQKAGTRELGAKTVAQITEVATPLAMGARDWLAKAWGKLTVPADIREVAQSVRGGATAWDRIARQRMQGAGPAEPWLAAPTFQEAQVDRLEKQLELLEKEKAEASKQRPGVEFTSPLEFWKQMQQRISTEQLDKRRNELLDNIDKNIEKTKTAIENLKPGVAAGA